VVGVRQASNQVQKIPEFEINSRTVLQPVVHYTCPTGKKALVKGSVQCTNRGAAARADFNAAGIRLFSWDRNTAIIGDYIDQPRSLSTINDGQQAFYDLELSAGDTIETTQTSGTNAEFNLFAKVQETPA